MEKTNKIPIAGKSIFLLLLGGGALLALVLLVILPSQAALNRKGREITAKEAELRERRTLYPIYSDFIARLQAQEDRALPFPEKSALSMEEINLFLKDFRGMAQSREMELIYITPDFNSMSDSADMLLINATLKGRFGNLRNILTGLGGVASLRHVEEVQINSAPGFKEFKVKFRLALRT